MAKVTNISNGPRGAYKDGVLVMAEVGETIEADDYADEWFGKAGGSDAKIAEAGASGDLSGLTKAQLLELAEQEGIAVETDDNKADLLAKIEAQRAA